jgi:hypothetical protein
MLQYTRRVVAPLVMALALATACKNGDDSALSADSSLSRDLARVGTDSAALRALQVVPPGQVGLPAPVAPGP